MVSLLHYVVVVVVVAVSGGLHLTATQVAGPGEGLKAFYFFLFHPEDYFWKSVVSLEMWALCKRKSKPHKY